MKRGMAVGEYATTVVSGHGSWTAARARIRASREILFGLIL